MELNQHRQVTKQLLEVIDVTLLSWLTVETKTVASWHVVEKMLENYDLNETEDHTLHQDATSKFHCHYEGAQITMKDG